jgi:hypothetical protein
MLHEPGLREDLAARGFARRIGEWSEAEHLERYLDLIQRARAGRSGQLVYRPALARADRRRQPVAEGEASPGD